MARTHEEAEAYLLDMIQQRDWLLLQFLKLGMATTANECEKLVNEVWDKFQRPVPHTQKSTLDLTPEAMLKERIESYATPKSQIIKDNVPDIAEIIEPKKELSVEDVFGTSDNKYWIVEYPGSYYIKNDNDQILCFNKQDEKAERKAKLALKLLNQCEPDDIDLLIEMLN